MRSAACTALVCAALGLGALGSATAPAYAADAPRTRAAFAAAVATLRPGASFDDVRAALGAPDAVRAACRGEAADAEVWGWGTDAGGGFPTLGTVVFDSSGAVLRTSGGQPPAARGLPAEPALRSLLRRLDPAARGEFERYDPGAVVAAVNALVPQGKDGALAVVSEYLRVADRAVDRREGLFLVLRVLFDVPADTGVAPPLRIGAPDLAPPAAATALPRFPVLLVGDVPLLLVGGYTLGGLAESVESHVAWYREHGALRTAPLKPGAAAAATLAGFAAAWSKAYGAPPPAGATVRARRQLARSSGASD